MSVDLLNAAEPDATLAPDAAVFATRAARFAQLANGHALGPWLAFLGQLSLAQSQLSQLPPAPPAAAQQPVWPAEARTLPAEWPQTLHQLGALLSQDAPPPWSNSCVRTTVPRSP
jgi:FdhE protein